MNMNIFSSSLFIRQCRVIVEGMNSYGERDKLEAKIDGVEIVRKQFIL